MAYIGQEPLVEFSSIPTKDSFTGDGSTVAFDMSAAVVSAADNALEVFVDNVRQEPGSGKAYTVGLDGSNDNKRITFSAAPASGAAIYVINDKSNTTTLVTPTNLGGVELILDADSDTSITADTDDQIDFKIGSADHLKILSSSGDTVFKPMVDAKDIVFQQFDGNKIFCIDDGNFVSVGGNSAAPGEIRIYEDTDLGANYTGFKAGNLTASVAYQLPLADGSSGQALATDGSGVLSWTTIATNTPTSADGQALGSASLEWSDLFLADGAVINLGADQDVTLTHVADTGVLLNGASVIQFRDSGLTIGSNADGDLDIVSDGTAVDSINIESAGGITLDAGTAGSGVIYEDDGTEMLRIHNSSSDVILETKVSDKDFIIKGNDGGSVITPLTLDMSAGGDLFLTGGLIDLKNDGTAVSQIKFYCESSNAHAQTLIGAPHAQSATNTLTLPDGSDGVLVSTVSTATLTNKTLTTPVIAEIDSGSTITLDATTDIILDADGGDVFVKDAGTTYGSLTNTSGNLIIKSGTTTAATFSGANVTFAGTIGSGAITSTGIVTGTGFTAGNAVLAEAELELLDGLTAGTAIASKVVTTDANIDSTGMRNLTISGELDAATGDFSGAVDVAGATTTAAITASGLITANANITMAGTTPTLTIGDAGAEDAKIVFDGNAQDFHIGLDDSADDLVIGKGSALGTTPAITINEDLQTTIVNHVNPKNSFRNIVINGDMSIAQRATSVTGITTGGYRTADRMYLNMGTAGTWTNTISTDVPSGQGFATSFKLDCTTANGSLSAGSFMTLQHRIEAQNLHYIKKGTSSAESLTLSFWVKSAKTGTYIAYLKDDDNNRDISKSYTISSANTWEKKTVTFPPDTTGAFNNDNGIGLYIYFWLVAGSTYLSNNSSSLQTAWASSANSAAGQVNLADSTSNDWYITGIQLETGTTASDFEFLPIEVDLQRCQRYYQKLTGSYAQHGQISNVHYNGTGQAQGVYTYPVKMRATPTLSHTTTSSNNSSSAYVVAANGGTDFIDSLALYNANNHSTLIYTNVGGAGTSGHGGNLSVQSAITEAALVAEL